MKVVVLTLATLYEVTGRFRHEVEVPEGSTVLDVIRELVRRYPRLGEEIFEDEGISGDIVVLVDGRPVESVGGLGRRLEGGETIVLIPPAGGGVVGLARMLGI